MTAQDIYSPKYQRLDGNSNETSLNCVNILSKVSMVINELSVTLKFGKIGEQTIKIYSYLSNKLKTSCPWSSKVREGE